MCSTASIAGLYFDFQNRAACPGETAAIDTGAMSTHPAPRCYLAAQPPPMKTCQ